MAWRVEIARSAEKEISKLDRQHQISIATFLRERIAAAENPRQLGKPLQGDKKGLWRYRVGDYRLICDIQENRVTVLWFWRLDIERKFTADAARSFETLTVTLERCGPPLYWTRSSACRSGSKSIFCFPAAFVFYSPY